MITSAAIYHVLHFFHITIDIRNVCVFLAPLFSSFTTIVTYHLTKELKVWGRSGYAVCLFASCCREDCCSELTTPGKWKIILNFHFFEACLCVDNQNLKG